MPLMAAFWMPSGEDLRLVLPELLLVGTLAALLIVPIFSGRQTRSPGVIALLGAFAAGVAALLAFDGLPFNGIELFAVKSQSGFVTAPGMLVADGLGLFFRVLLMFFLMSILVMWSLFDAPRERHPTEFLVLLVSSAIGMALMTTSVNLLMMIIAIELASLPSYAMTAFDRTRRAAAEAALKYVVFGAATTGFMIFGASLLFGLTGTLHIPTLVQRLADAAAAPGLPTTLVALALLTVFAGVGFKISAVPFHFWCPDVFEGASLPVATWLSVASKAAGVVLLVRLVGFLSDPGAPAYVGAVLPLITYGVGLLAVLTCTIANLAAYRQTSVRRLLAYSSIAHAGYMLAAGAIVTPAAEVSSGALSAVVAYLVVYMFMNYGAFMALGLVAVDRGSESLSAFRGLGWRDPPTAAALTICLVSLIGLPPLGGFIVKWWLIYALGSAAVETPLLWMLAGAVVINTAISLYYYARVIAAMYLTGIEETGGLRAPLWGKVAVCFCALVLLFTGTLWISPLKRNADAVAGARFAPTARSPNVAQLPPTDAPRLRSSDSSGASPGN